VITPSTSLPASARSARSRRTGPSALDEATSNDTSARLSVVFTDWPPGPDDLENRHVSSSGGITAPRTLMGPATVPWCLRRATGFPARWLVEADEERGRSVLARKLLRGQMRGPNTQ
jgi:hypothetical protein